MSHKIRLTRGTTATNREAALQAGLNLYNNSSKRNADYRYPPGQFFTRWGYDTTPTPSESWATMCADKENKSGVVIDLNITAENFPILQGRIFILKRDRLKGRRSDMYLPINDYDDLKRTYDETVVRLAGLTHEDLTGLGLVVGFRGDDGTYEYRTYQEWSEALGIRARSREEITAMIEGTHTPPQMKK